MAGSYCEFCDQRCFVEREIPDPSFQRYGRRLHMATCVRGKAHDREKTGYDCDTAINPHATPSTKPKYRPIHAALGAIYGSDEDVLSTLREMNLSELESLHRAAAYLTDKCEAERQDRGDA